MAISSASTRIFKAEDPVMETDLQLLAKVNTYQQEKFDEGEKSLQNEVNNWSLLANVAKPQDKDYINAKLNKLVSGIQNLGGVNLADPNNVNSLKSLGYNLYGDDNVMNPVVTTQKMTQLAQDIQTKTNGKNAKNYDPVYGEYLQNQYSKWLNDGQQGTSFNGPTALPEGSFDNYNKKVSDALAKLQPDINEAPQDSKDAALNYYQVSDKFIKKDRVEAAIDAVTSAGDRDVLSAHAWKSMRGLGDSDILALQNNEYSGKLKDLQDNYNFLQYQKSLATDFKQKQLFTTQMEQLDGAMNSIKKQQKGLPVLKPGQQLPDEVRQGLSDNLFYNSFKSQYGDARAYEQKKVELKSNAAAMFLQKQAQEDYWHGKNYDIKLKELDLKEQDLAIKEGELYAKLYGTAAGANGVYGKFGNLGGPAQNAPLSLVPVKGKDDAIVLSNNTITQADAVYTNAAKNFYEQGYNYLISKDPVLYGNFLKQDTEGNWVPKDAKSADIVNKGLQSFTQLYGNIANMSIKERDGLKLTNDDLELYKRSKELEETGLYKQQIQNITSDVFRKAGLDDPNVKTITIPFSNGTKATVTYAKLKEMIDKKDPLLETWQQGANIDIPSFSSGSMTGLPSAPTRYNSVNGAITAVNDYYDKSEVKKAWDDVSKTVNPYAQIVSLPKIKGKLPDEPAKIIADQITDPSAKKNVDLADIDINKVWTTYDPKTNEAHYRAEVRYRKASSGNTKNATGEKYTNVDLTDIVNKQFEAGGGWISNLYAKDNASVVYGLALQNEGKTPFDSKNNFQGALQTHGQGLLSHKYQILSVRDPKTKGVTGYKVSVAIPLGKDNSGNPKFQVMTVPNFLQDASGATTTFPANFDGVRAYMEAAFKDTDSAKDFYTRLGVPYNQ